MQLSEQELRDRAMECFSADVLAGDQISVREAVKETVRVVLNALAEQNRAQADARPCQYPNCGCDSRAKCTSNFNGAPKAAEASAPGLSEFEIRDLAVKYCAYETDGKCYNIVRYEIEEDFFNFCRALISLASTRASAATVAEPSTANTLAGFQGAGAVNGRLPTEQEIWDAGVRSGMRRAEAAQQQANPLGIKPQPLGAEFDKVLHDNLSSLYIEDGKQQAEPGADERAAFEVWDKQYCDPGDHHKNGRGEYIEERTQERWETWQARAAQSGQRAGVAEDVLDAVRAALPEFSQQDDYLLAHGASLMSDNSHEIIHVDTLKRIIAAVQGAPKGWQLVPKEPTKEMIAAGQAVDKEYTYRTVGPECGIHCADCYDHYKAMLAAAPTQQQEGGK